MFEEGNVGELQSCIVLSLEPISSVAWHRELGLDSSNTKCLL